MARNRRRAADQSSATARPDANADDLTPDDETNAADTSDEGESVSELENDAPDDGGSDAGDDDEAADDAAPSVADESDDDESDDGESDEDEPDDGESDDEPESDGDASDGDEREAVLVGATAKVRGARTAAKAKADDTSGKRSTGSKGRATPRQRDQTQTQRRTGPIEFLRESYSELRKVVYPSSKTLGTYFVVVLVFVLFVIGYVTVLDLGFGWVILKVFG